MSSARTSIAIAIGVFALASPSCAPCAGTAACTTEPRFVLLGSMVEPSDGLPVAGVRIDVVLAQGTDTILNSSVTTGADGLWSVRATGADAPATVSAVIAAGTAGAFSVPSFVVQPTTRGGEAIRLAPWLRRPYVYRLLSLSSNLVPLVHATVRFQPTGGAALPGAAEVVGLSNGAGIADMPVFGAAVGDVTGTLTVTHPTFSAPRVINGFAIAVGYEFRFPFYLSVTDFP